MPSLLEAQTNFIDTINNGPDALKADLFAGDASRVMLGLRAHANTISHARLVALEETFPRTMEMLGADIFNDLCRKFCETAQAQALNNNSLGKDFPSFLANGNADADICDLATIEWQWLISYHSAEAEPLALADLAGLSEEQLLCLPAPLHPSARCVKLSAPLSTGMPELTEHRNAAAILITRPNEQVMLHPLNDMEYQLFIETNKKSDEKLSIGNLLAFSAEQSEEGDALAPIITLINSGTFAA